MRKVGVHNIRNIEPRSKSGRRSKNKELHLRSRLLDPQPHLVVVIKENLDPNFSASNNGSRLNSLRFKNLVYHSSLPVGLKEKISVGNFVFEDKGGTPNSMLEGSVSVEDTVHRLVQVLNDECHTMGEPNVLAST